MQKGDKQRFFVIFTHNQPVLNRSIAYVACGGNNKKIFAIRIFPNMLTMFLISWKTRYTYNDRANMSQTDQLYKLIMMASFQIYIVLGFSHI